MVRATCSALHCPSSSRTHKDLKFHQFPHDAIRRKMWLTACKRSDVIDKDWVFFKHKYICSKHFQKCMYSKKDYLKKSAVPSLHLSEKPLQHDSSTQTTVSLQYIRPYFEQNGDVKEQLLNVASILYVTKPNVEKSSASTYTQTVDLQYDIHDVNIKGESMTDSTFEESGSIKQEKNKIKTEKNDDHKKIDWITFEDDEIETENKYDDENSDSEIFEEDVLIETENGDDDENSDSKIFKEGVLIETENGDDDQSSDSEIFKKDVKIEIVENPILPNNPVSQSTQCEDPEIIKENYTFCGQTEKQTVNIDKLAESNTTTDPSMLTVIKEQDESIQTDRVIVLRQYPDGTEESINPIDCKCKRNTNEEMTRAQFFRCCSKFLSPSFSNLVRTQMYLDGVSKQAASKLGAAGSSSEAEGIFNFMDEEYTQLRQAVVWTEQKIRGRGRPRKTAQDYEMEERMLKDDNVIVQELK